MYSHLYGQHHELFKRHWYTGEIGQTALLHLQEMDLFLKPKKCEFKRTRMIYLGMVIEEGKFFMDPVKLKGIKDWPILTTVKQVQSFLGFGNCKTIEWLVEKRQTFQLDQGVSKSFGRLENSIHCGTHFMDAWSNTSLPNWGRCFQVCNWSSTNSNRCKWR